MGLCGVLGKTLVCVATLGRILLDDVASLDAIDAASLLRSSV